MIASFRKFLFFLIQFIKYFIIITNSHTQFLLILHFTSPTYKHFTEMTKNILYVNVLNQVKSADNNNQSIDGIML